MTKGLLALYGESFRLGGQNSRDRGSDKSYKEQMAAAKTHMKFIESLKLKNVDMKVSINSYTTKFDKSLKDVYKDVLVYSIFYPDLLGQTHLIRSCIDKMKILNTNEFDFVLFMRIDLFLKDKFMEIFNPYSDNILFPSICWKIGNSHMAGPHPRVNDMMLFTPKKYVRYVRNVIKIGHDTWSCLVDDTDLTYKNLDTMLNTFHDSDSAKDFNPIYYIVNRPQTKCWHCPHDIFNKNKW